MNRSQQGASTGVQKGANPGAPAQRGNLMVDPLTWTVLSAPPRWNLPLLRFPNLSSSGGFPRKPWYEQMGTLKSRLLELLSRLAIEFAEERCIALELTEWNSVITISYDDLNDYYGHLSYLIDGGNSPYLFPEGDERLENLRRRLVTENLILNGWLEKRGLRFYITT